MFVVNNTYLMVTYVRRRLCGVQLVHDGLERGGRWAWQRQHVREWLVRSSIQLHWIHGLDPLCNQRYEPNHLVQRASIDLESMEMMRTQIELIEWKSEKRKNENKVEYIGIATPDVGTK